MAMYFSIFLVVASAITGLVWLVYAQVFAKKAKAIQSAETAAPVSISSDENQDEELPPLVDMCKQLFPIFFGVMVFRSFIYEPFQIPTGSMIPTLLVGDFLLVEKFSYSLRDPIARKEILKVGEVKRGDVIVFKYPEDEKMDYIKRVVAVPGDEIVYRNKQLFIKEACDELPCPPMQAIPFKSIGRADPEILGERGNLFEETIGGVTHSILRKPRISPKRPYTRVVKEGEYIAFGDNRDNSQDSRTWGVVPEENIVGKAVFIWISFEFKRDESDFIPTWVPTGVRFDRIGRIK